MSDKVETASKNLMQKLVEIMNTVDRVPKNGHNDRQNYSYAQESDIKEVVRKELADRNVIMIPNELDKTTKEIPTRNGSQQLVTLKIEYTLIDADSGESVKMIGYGDGQDSGDKAVYKAKTGALKYALTSLFMIPTGDDPERPLQPSKNIDKQQLDSLDALITKVAEMSGSVYANVLRTLKVEMGYTNEIKEMTEDQFGVALQKLRDWEKSAYERQQNNDQQQNQNNRTQNEENINWGQR
ncbi:hypothetical protein IGI66_001769 [Enterococcus sp. AZ048]|uniref:ERF family protein n=1 Tax=Enterococcus sp. AZ048 TaxID=2774658 RepID=UPI003F25A8E5